MDSRAALNTPVSGAAWRKRSRSTISACVLSGLATGPLPPVHLLKEPAEQFSRVHMLVLLLANRHRSLALEGPILKALPSAAGLAFVPDHVLSAKVFLSPQLADMTLHSACLQDAYSRPINPFQDDDYTVHPEIGHESPDSAQESLASPSKVPLQKHS